MIESDNIKRILIFQTAFIGDVILTTPLIEQTKRLFPGADIFFLGTPVSADLVSTNPHLHNTIIYDKKRADRGLLSVIKLIKQLRSLQFDMTLVPHRSLRSALIVTFAGIPKRIGFHTSAGAWLFTQQVKYDSDIHEIKRNVSLLALRSENLEIPAPRIYPNEAEKQKISIWLHEHDLDANGCIIGIAPGSIWATKRWPVEKYIETMKIIRRRQPDSKIVLIGGDDDHLLCKRIQELTDNSVLNTAGNFTLRESCELLSRCAVVLCNDSAPTHMGVAMGTPVVAIFGPTIQAFGFSPYGENNHIIEIPDLYCRPCGMHGGHKCPEKHFRCMLDINPELVAQVVLSYENTKNK